MRRTAVALALVFSVAAIVVGSAGSATTKSSYLIFSESETAASNGLVLEAEFAGTFNAADKTASGEGEFAIKAGSTTVEHGTFEVTGLVAFQSYGCGFVEDIDLGDDTLCGGRVIFTVHAVTSTGEEGDGLLEVNCQIHGPNNQAPPGTSEGVKVNARGINFNKHVAGDNVFILQP